jgi:hypothetical protein
MIGIVIRLATGSLSQLNKKKIIEFIALSSIFNLRWILTAILSNLKITAIFVTLYWISVTLTITTIRISKIKNNLKEMKRLPS